MEPKDLLKQRHRVYTPRGIPAPKHEKIVKIATQFETERNREGKERKRQYRQSTQWEGIAALSERAKLDIGRRYASHNPPRISFDTSVSDPEISLGVEVKHNAASAHWEGIAARLGKPEIRDTRRVRSENIPLPVISFSLTAPDLSGVHDKIEEVFQRGQREDETPADILGVLEEEENDSQNGSDITILVREAEPEKKVDEPEDKEETPPQNHFEIAQIPENPIPTGPTCLISRSRHTSRNRTPRIYSGPVSSPDHETTQFAVEKSRIPVTKDSTTKYTMFSSPPKKAEPVLTSPPITASPTMIEPPIDVPSSILRPIVPQPQDIQPTTYPQPNHFLQIPREPSAYGPSGPPPTWELPPLPPGVAEAASEAWESEKAWNRSVRARERTQKMGNMNREVTEFDLTFGLNEGSPL